jgi:NodT family efflux transporter outer membrane factor (OMF) lipoprotein
MKFYKINTIIKTGILVFTITLVGCKSLAPVPEMQKTTMPEAFVISKDSTNNAADIKWNQFFVDKNLNSLIDVALKNNIDLQITLQDIEISKNQVKLRNGLLFPSVVIGATAGLEKVGRYTSQGAGDASAQITDGQLVPENLGNLGLGLHASWEVDIWKKLRNSKKAAFTKYLSTIEGKNFVITNLVAEIANSYYDLLSLDNKLNIIQETIQLQKNALEIVKVQKDAARTTELGVQKFEAEVLNSQGLEFDIMQQIKENENNINFLLARYPQAIVRDESSFTIQIPQQIKEGIPSQLLKNRPDIKQAELDLLATKFDVKVARAEFYPSLNIGAGVGFNAFKSEYLFTTPESAFYNIVGDLVAPLINRSAIKAQFNTAKAVQIQAMYNYQKTILNGYVEVSNEISNINNLQKLYNMKAKEVQTLIKSVAIANDLFKSSKADYFEVLMTQRDALSSKLELIEAKKRQFNSVINCYKALGGGWK